MHVCYVIYVVFVVNFIKIVFHEFIIYKQNILSRINFWPLCIRIWIYYVVYIGFYIYAEF